VLARPPKQTLVGPDRIGFAAELLSAAFCVCSGIYEVTIGLQ